MSYLFAGVGDLKALVKQAQTAAASALNTAPATLTPTMTSHRSAIAAAKRAKEAARKREAARALPSLPGAPSPSAPGSSGGLSMAAKVGIGLAGLGAVAVVVLGGKKKKKG